MEVTNTPLVLNNNQQLHQHQLRMEVLLQPSTSDGMEHKVELATVKIPSGSKILVRPITLQCPCKPRLILQIDGTLLAPSNVGSWPKDSLFQWLNFKWIENFTIQGSGTVDGQGSGWCNFNYIQFEDFHLMHAPKVVVKHEKIKKVAEKIEMKTKRKRVSFDLPMPRRASPRLKEKAQNFVPKRRVLRSNRSLNLDDPSFSLEDDLDDPILGCGLGKRTDVSNVIPKGKKSKVKDS